MAHLCQCIPLGMGEEMNLKSFVLGLFGCLIIATGLIGQCTGNLDSFAIHSCNSEGTLIIIFAVVLDLHVRARK